MSEEIKNEAVSEEISSSFIDDFIIEDLAEGGRCEGMKVHTRFPPEPNGYLHIGHAKAIYVDFGTAERFNGICNLRMDDTNPTKEDVEYVDAIKEDIHWLGYDWEDRFYYASDYFEDMYNGAVELIKKGLAYVCELTPDQMREMRGDLTTPAQSPYRDRPMEESFDLFARMRAGEFEDGRMTLRAKIDLASGNFNMRDPVIYRINHMPHHRTGTKWCIYPMYDFAHPIEDAMEHITHSLCSLEFEDHRPLYDWVINNVTLPAKPRQIEFARLGINNTVMSKRKLRALVEGGYVSGWDDPRMPTICGLRRRGYTPASIRNFSVRNGVSKVNSTVEYSFLEHCLREDLNLTAKRVMGVLNPVKLILTNYPEDRTETFEVENNPNRPEDGTRTVTFGRELYIEAEDFMETPVKGYFRLFPGNEVRLKTTYVVKCTGCKKDENGNVAADALSVVTYPKKTVYQVGEPLKANDMEILAKYADGGEVIINPANSEIEGFKRNEVGEQTLTYTYQGVKLTFKVTVNEKTEDSGSESTGNGGGCIGSVGLGGMAILGLAAALVCLKKKKEKI